MVYKHSYVLVESEVGTMRVRKNRRSSLLNMCFDCARVVLIVAQRILQLISDGCIIYMHAIVCSSLPN